MGLSLADIMRAAHRIGALASGTPLLPSPHPSGLSGADILMKLEIAQPIGAFKLRGGPGLGATTLSGRNMDMALFTRVIAGQDVHLADDTVKRRPYAP